MSTMQIKDIAEQFAAAQAAIDAKPELEARIKQLQDDLDSQTDIANRLANTLADERHVIGGLKQTVSSLEVERDSYGFRAIEAEHKLETILSVVGPKAIEAQPAQVATAASPGDATLVVGEQPDRITDHEADTTDHGNIHAATTHYPDAGITEVSVKQEGGNGPFVNSTMTAQSQPAQTTSVGNMDTVDSSTSSKPVVVKRFSGAGPDAKPYSMTWGEFEDLGGRKPEWANRHWS